MNFQRLEIIKKRIDLKLDSKKILIASTKVKKIRTKFTMIKNQS